MTPGAVSYLMIEWPQLGIAVIFVVASGVLSMIQHLGVGRSLLIGTVRTFVQLIAVGYLIKLIFHLDSPWLILGYFAFTCIMAAWVVRNNVKSSLFSIFLPSLGAILLTSFVITMCVTGGVLQASPWWEPQYFIPLGGMITGNVMTAISIGFKKWLEGIKDHAGDVEMRLTYGASLQEASREVFRECMKLAMMPTIMSMMSVGLVQLPGMMTGQILSGVDPTHAVRYQIVVMLMLTAATAFGSYLALLWARRRSFGPMANLLKESEREISSRN